MRQTRTLARPLVFLLFLGLVETANGNGSAPNSTDVEFFEAKVRPILVERCYSCHSANAKKVRGHLLLDSKAGWEHGGDSGPVIIPGDPDKSLIVQAVRYDDDVLKMPPKRKLPEAEIAVLTDWVRRGAFDPRTEPVKMLARKTIDIEKGRQHWAFQPLHRIEPPDFKHDVWSRSPIDRFLDQRLQEQGLTPSDPASRRQLIRRASFDLTGLPPTPEAIDAFLKDDAPDAFDRLVSRLLDSPHYGERWARHWLDLTRFAESHGFEHDYDRPTAYPYRDFVIKALNSDLPYNTFASWQLAGDELSPDNNLALQATGFLAAGVHSTQITANQVEKERYDELDDMANITGTAFLGLTIGCARCHDHKFDPIPVTDYYRFLSTFTTTVRSEIDLVPDPDGYARAKAKYEAEHAPYVAALAVFEADELPKRLESWEASRDPNRQGARWVVLDPNRAESKGGATFTKVGDGSWKVRGTNANFDTYTVVTACDLAEITAVRVEALSDPDLPHGGPGRAPNGNFALTDLKVKVGPRYGIGQTNEPPLINPKATFEQPGLPVSAVIDGDQKSGWAVDPQFGKDHAAVFEFGSDLLTDSGATLTFTLAFLNNTGHNLGRFRLSATDSPRPIGIDDDGIPKDVAPILAIPHSERSTEQTTQLLAWYKSIDRRWQTLKTAIDDHAKTAPQSNGVKTLISTEGLPAVRLHTQGADFLEKTHVLKRGDPSQKLEEAAQGFLQVLMTSSDGEQHWQTPPPEGWRTSYRRTALAHWLTDVDQGAGALLARVIVNRLWQHHFGRGIVATPSDFGTQGDPPSHPELLDWLANELIQNGWRLKPIHQLIMTSSAYRQGSRIDDSKSRIDPENRLVSRQSRPRLEAEAVRDALLAVSGALDLRPFGPGTLDERMTRRSIYFTVKRSKLIPMMTLFDAPDALQAIAVRSSTTIAPQALYLMNSPVVRDLAAAFARRIAPGPGDPLESSIRSAYVLALSRPPEPEELAAALAFIAHQSSTYQAAGHANPVEPALTDFCQMIFCLNEFIFIE
ncbi:MAG: PSD1 and planctomycete cytochrome C domain-containing protein [Isosphaeraceae bacterium]